MILGTSPASSVPAIERQITETLSPRVGTSPAISLPGARLYQTELVYPTIASEMAEILSRLLLTLRHGANGLGTTGPTAATTGMP